MCLASPLLPRVLFCKGSLSPICADLLLAGSLPLKEGRPPPAQRPLPLCCAWQVPGKKAVHLSVQLSMGKSGGVGWGLGATWRLSGWNPSFQGERKGTHSLFRNALLMGKGQDSDSVGWLCSRGNLEAVCVWRQHNLEKPSNFMQYTYKRMTGLLWWLPRVSTREWDSVCLFELVILVLWGGCETVVHGCHLSSLGVHIQ